MRSPLRLVAAALAIVAVFTIAGTPRPARADDPDQFPVGSVAPNFESEDTEGQPFVLADALKQGPVMLVFWSLFCGTCIEELPIIQQELPKLQQKVQVITVNLDEGPRARNVKMVATQKGFTFRMLLNKLDKKAADGTLVRKEYQIDLAYKVKATPALYIVNRDGTIAFGHYGALNPEELAQVVDRAR